MHDASQFVNSMNFVLLGYVLGMLTFIAMQAVHQERHRKRHCKLCPKCSEGKAKGRWIGGTCKACLKLATDGLREQYRQLASMERQRMIMARLTGSNDGGDPDSAAKHEALGAHGRTYEVSKDRKSIKCLVCNMTSHNGGDVSNKYCARCRKFHEEVPGL